MEISKRVVLYFLIIFYIIFSSIIQISNISSFYGTFVNPFVWLLFSLFSYYVMYNEKKRIKNKVEKKQYVLIIVMIYLLVYFGSGVIFGYSKTPYSHSFLNFIINIWTFVIIIFFQEYTREALLSSNKIKWYHYLIVSLIFTIAEINFYRFSDHFVDYETSFKYISSTIIPIIAHNLLFSYLVVVGGKICSYYYRIPIALTNIIIPLFPNLEWFWSATFELILVMAIYIRINFIKEKDLKIFRNRYKRKKMRLVVPFYLLIVLFVCGVSGILEYQPVAIMSNSMADLITRGDVVVIKKLNDKEKMNLQINDIIQYRLDGSTVIHRIVEINKYDKEITFITKGDNNKHNDRKSVSIDQICGKAIFRVPKIGYPSVMINEMFQHKKPNVET